jgi:hypothetical protein
MEVDAKRGKIGTHFYRTFEEFRQKIWAFFEPIEPYKQEVETLIS